MFCAGIKRQTMNATNNWPINAVTASTGAKSNILRGLPSSFSQIETMMMFAGVPISVAMLPEC